MLVMSSVAADARVLREAQTLAESGRSVRVIGMGGAPQVTWPTSVTVESVTAVSPFPSGRTSSAGRVGSAARWTLLPLHQRAKQASFVSAARAAALREPCDVVHAHDFPTLALGVGVAQAHDARLVYDVHECWTGRRREGRPTPQADRRDQHEEARLGERADAVLTVSPALAAWLRLHYGWRHITVVRNSFPTGAARPPEAGLRPRGLVYAGRVARGRDLPTVARAAPLLAPLSVTLVGPVEPSFARALGGRLDLRPPVGIDQVDDVLRQAGLALIPLEDGWENHRVALPNKLFQAVRAGVPVVAADLPELRRVVTAHGIGTLYRAGSVDSLVAAVREADARYAELLRNVASARRAFSWDEDAARLLDVYAALESAVTRSGRR